jgi:hypothetical protein
MKPDLETMNTTDLRSYVLEHREDREAFQGEHPNGANSTND